MTRILLVESDESDAKRVDGSLRSRADWEVVHARTILEAIRAAGDSHFDAAVVGTDLPDGSGIDILDFLRIGSPGIRIVLLSPTASESVAFHALSHGAGDFIVKDPHLEQELPRRIDALLDSPDPMSALVETLSASRAYETATPLPPALPPPRAIRTEPSGENAELLRTLRSICHGAVLAAGVWDLRGKPLGATMPEGVEPEGAGFALASLHGQVGALWTYGNLKPTGYRLVIDIDGGVLAVTAIPGTYIVALLFEEGFAAGRALDRVEIAGLQILAALHDGSSGEDLAEP